MDIHLVGLVVVELLPDGGLVFGGQAGPGLVCPAVILGAGRDLYVVVELDNLKKERAELKSPVRVSEQVG